MSTNCSTTIQMGKIHHPHSPVDQNMVTPDLCNQVRYLAHNDPPAQIPHMSLEMTTLNLMTSVSMHP